jgi:hypothetical protein
MHILVTLAISISGLFGQSPQPSDIAGAWEGELSYMKDGLTQKLKIVEFDIDERGSVTGRYAIYNDLTNLGVLTGGKINKDLVLSELFLRSKEGAVANGRLDGPIELIGTGDSAVIRSKVTENPKRAFRYQDFHGRGKLDDETHPATIELHRTKKGALAPSTFTLKHLN